LSRRLYDQGSKCTTPVEGIFTKNNPLCLRDVTKNSHKSHPSFCSKHVDYQPNSNAVRHAEGDYLFSEDLVQKRKFRLLIDRQREAQIRAEIYPPGFRLKDMIVMKYASLGIPVEVESYHIQDQGKTNVKAFNIIFENSWDVKKAFDLVVRGQLFFSLREARPSPTYHVKYEVIYPAGVFEGKCFRQQQIHQLRKGDIVTTNQLKGNKVRIIKWCPVGSKIQVDISGWVLLRTKEMFLLRRIEHRVEKQPVVKSESRSTILNPVLQNPKLGQPLSRRERQILQKCNSKRVSAANCSPFKVLVEVEVRKGRKESTIVGLLKPGRIAWANQHKGSMLRIMKMDHSGNIVYGSTMKPEVWGWVCLQRRGEKPRLLRILNTTVIKTKKTQEVPGPREEVRSKGYNFTNSQSQNQWWRNMRKSRTSRVAEANNFDKNITVSRHLVEAKTKLMIKKDQITIQPSPDCSKAQAITEQPQDRENFLVSEMSKTFVPSMINIVIPQKSRNDTGQLKPKLLHSIPGSINYSRSVSPMSTSSLSSRPVWSPGL